MRQRESARSTRGSASVSDLTSRPQGLSNLGDPGEDRRLDRLLRLTERNVALSCHRGVSWPHHQHVVAAGPGLEHRAEVPGYFTARLVDIVADAGVAGGWYWTAQGASAAAKRRQGICARVRARACGAPQFGGGI